MIQTTDIRRILDRVTRHPMMRDIPFETAVEHTVDFIKIVGVPALFDERTAIVKVNDWRGQLPCDFESMVQVRVAGAPTRCYRYSGDSFHMSKDKPSGDAGLTYKIQGMVIFTSTRDVDVEIAYRAFAVDGDGYPLLPDSPKFLRGLESYIKMKWFEVKYDMGEIPEGVMERADREYAWNVGSAQSEMSSLSLDEAETLFNSFKMLLPRNSEHWKGFFTNGSREIWKH